MSPNELVFDRKEISHGSYRRRSTPGACFPHLPDCDICRDVPVAMEDINESTSLDNIARGFLNGCGVCALITQGLAAFTETLGCSERDKYKTLSILRYFYPHTTGCVLGLAANHGNARLSLLLRNDSCAESATGTTPPPPPLHLPWNIPNQLELSRAVSLASNWLEECARGHQYCRSPKDTELPKRVMEISSAAGDVIRLVQDLKVIFLV